MDCSFCFEFPRKRLAEEEKVKRKDVDADLRLALVCFFFLFFFLWLKVVEVSKSGKRREGRRMFLYLLDAVVVLAHALTRSQWPFSSWYGKKR